MMNSSLTFTAKLSFSSLGLRCDSNVQARKIAGDKTCDHNNKKGTEEKFGLDINGIPSSLNHVKSSNSQSLPLSSIIYTGIQPDTDSSVVSADGMPVSVEIVVCDIGEIKSALEIGDVGQDDKFCDSEDGESVKREKLDAFLIIRSGKSNLPQASEMERQANHVLGRKAQPLSEPVVLVCGISGSSGGFASTNEDNRVAVWIPVNPSDPVLSLEFESKDDLAEFLPIARVVATDCKGNDVDLASRLKSSKKYGLHVSSLGHKRKRTYESSPGITHSVCITASSGSCYGSSHRSDGLIIVAKKDAECNDAPGYEIVRSRSSMIPCSTFPYFVTLAEWPHISDYHFLLMCQIKRTKYGSDSRLPNRKVGDAVVEGYAGFKCRHCDGAKKGVYYPSSGRNLQANSGLYKHLMKCPCCPDGVKRALQLSKPLHKQQIKGRKSGYQGYFFDVIWQRLHDRNFIADQESEEIEHIIFQIIQKYRKYRIPMDCAPATLLQTSTTPKYPAIHDAPENEEAIANLFGRQDAISHGGNASTDECEIMMNSFREGSGSRSVAGICQDPVQLKKSETCLSDSATQIRLISSSQSLSLQAATFSSVVVPASECSSSRNIALADDDHCLKGEMSSRTPLLLSTPSSAQSKRPGLISKAVNNNSTSMGFNLFFSHEDDEKLIKGLLKYGTKWSLIYSECGLGHIPRSLIRDRASTVQFRELLERTQKMQSNFRTPDAPNQSCKWRQSEKKKQGDHNLFDSKYSVFESAIPLLACTTPCEDFCLVSPLPSGESGFKSLLDDEDMVYLNEVLCGKEDFQQFDNQDINGGKCAVNLADI